MSNQRCRPGGLATPGRTFRPATRRQERTSTWRQPEKNLFPKDNYNIANIRIDVKKNPSGTYAKPEGFYVKRTYHE